MPLILGANSVSGGYEVDNSLRFNSASSDYLSRTQGAGDRQKWTYSVWVKRSKLGTNQNWGICQADSANNNIMPWTFTTGDKIDIYDYNGAISFQLIPTQVFRDVSAWYHFVLAVDTTQATASNRTRLYVNGSEITSFTTATYPSQNYNFNLNQTGKLLTIGAYYTSSASTFTDIYMSDIFFIDGQQLTPTSFGETDEDTNIWKPIPYTGSFGTNGFYLEFKDSSALGDDTSGNGNDFTVNNLTSIDQTTDTPTNNFATLNPLVNYQAYPPVLTEGNLKNTSNANASNGGTSPSTIVVSQGKWYAEMKVGANKQDGTALGIVTDSYRFDYQNDAAFYISASFSSVAYLGDGRKVISNTFSAYGATFTANDIIGIAVDLDNDTVTFYKNGVSQGVISTTLTGGYFICCYGYNSSVQEINFGNPPFTISSGNADGAGFGNFEYAVPSGYFALCTKNLANFG
jgi:hypothetical protein